MQRAESHGFSLMPPSRSRSNVHRVYMRGDLGFIGGSCNRHRPILPHLKEVESAMSVRNRQGSTAQRATKNREFQRELAERKHLRKSRARIHAAMTEARTMQKSRKKGTSKVFDVNMAKLGYTPTKDYAMGGKCPDVGAKYAADHVYELAA